jgi:hypothetical protein
MDSDVKGDIYEGLLARSAAESPKGAGQYFTPRELIKAIVDVMRPTPEDTVCDPACGHGRVPAGGAQVRVDHFGKDLDPDQKKHLKKNFVHAWELVAGHGAPVHHEPVPARHRRRPVPGEGAAWTAWPAIPASASAWC